MCSLLNQYRKQFVPYFPTQSSINTRGNNLIINKIKPVSHEMVETCRIGVVAGIAASTAEGCVFVGACQRPECCQLLSILYTVTFQTCHPKFYDGGGASLSFCIEGGNSSNYSSSQHYSLRLKPIRHRSKWPEQQTLVNTQTCATDVILTSNVSI